VIRKVNGLDFLESQGQRQGQLNFTWRWLCKGKVLPVLERNIKIFFSVDPKVN